ncbi:MAG: histidine kinase [Robiginitomaculum sp.]|nr:MAG: histidine kinase [Robiginitomaculum sp.]
MHGETLILLRWIAIAGQTVAILLIEFGLDYHLPLKSCLAVIAASAWVNVYLGMSARNIGRISNRSIFWQLNFDLAQMGLLLGLTGGLSNPFLMLFAAPVVVAVTALRFREAIIMFAFVGIMIVGMAQFGFPLPAPDGQVIAVSSAVYRTGLAIATIITIAFTAIYVWRISLERNRMAQALSATETVLAKETRLAALGGLAAATAHELGTPLGTIQLVAKEINRGLVDNPDLKEDLELILSQAKACRLILQKLSTRGAENDLFHARHSLSALLEEITAAQPPSQITLHTLVSSKETGNPTPEPKLQRQPEILHALTAFVENALSFAKSAVEITGRWDVDWITITICDDGPGFDSAILERLGEPYVTSRRGGNEQGEGGLGLGFFISKTLIERTGGQIVCGKSQSMGGAMVQIVWPRAKIDLNLAS